MLAAFENPIAAYVTQNRKALETLPPEKNPVAANNLP
jgi:hypothetical protein